MSDQPHYRRLPGRAGIFVIHRAMLADDHLLAVQTVVFQERYRRLFFRDLEAFSIHENDRRLWLGVVTGVIAFLGWLIVMNFFPSRPGNAPLVALAVGCVGVVTAVALVAFVWNLALGRGCTCYVRTAVQTVHLPSLNRVRRARRARALIVERVGAAQAGLPPTPPEGSARASATTVVRPPTRGAAAPADAPPGGAPATDSRAALRALAANGGFSVVAALGVLYDYVEPGLPGFFANLLCVLAAMASSIVQLALGRGGRLPQAAKLAGLGVLAVTIVGAVVGYIAMITVSVIEATKRNPETVQRMEPFVVLSKIEPGTNAFIDVCYLAISAAYAVVGTWVLVVWTRLAVARRRGLPWSA